MKQKRILEKPRLLGIVWPFIAVVLLQALLGCVSLYMMSAVRSYIGGESLWSKGQKDAIYYLNLYANSRDDINYLKYQKALPFPRAAMTCAWPWISRCPTSRAPRPGFCKGATTLTMPRASYGFI